MRGVRHQLIQCIDHALSVLRRRTLGDEPVHEARKEMKRVRAGLRLLRDSLGETAYRALNRAVRDAARPLTPVRDAKVLRDVLDDLAKDWSKPAEMGGISPLRLSLLREQRSSREQLSRKELAATRSRLVELRRQLQSLPEARLDAASLGGALVRAYKKARNACKVAAEESSDENLHEWRKQVKYHVHQLEFAKALKLKHLGATIKQAHKLADCLGDDHDLAVLHGKIVQHAAETQAPAETTDANPLLKKISRCRAKLQRKARKSGRALYADKPRRVAKEMARLPA